MIIRTNKDKDHPYVMINKTYLYDKELTLEDKGMLTFCMGMKDGWQFNLEHLATLLPENLRTIRNIFRRLIDLGYCRFERKKNCQGKFIKADYVLYETRQKVSKTGVVVYPQNVDNSADLEKSLPHDDFCTVDETIPTEAFLETEEVMNNSTTEVMNNPNVQENHVVVSRTAVFRNVDLCNVALYISKEEVNKYPIPLPTNKESCITKGREGEGLGFLSNLLEKIAVTPADQRRLLETYPAALIQRVVAYVSRPEFIPRSSITHAVFYFCKHPDNMTDLVKKQENKQHQQRREDLAEFNKQWALQLYEKVQERNPMGSRNFQIGSQGAWFTLPHGDNSNTAKELICFGEHGFKDRIESNLRKLNLW